MRELRPRCVIEKQAAYHHNTSPTTADGQLTSRCGCSCLRGRGSFGVAICSIDNGKFHELSFLEVILSLGLKRQRNKGTLLNSGVKLSVVEVGKRTRLTSCGARADFGVTVCSVDDGQFHQLHFLELVLTFWLQTQDLTRGSGTTRHNPIIITHSPLVVLSLSFCLYSLLYTSLHYTHSALYMASSICYLTIIFLSHHPHSATIVINRRITDGNYLIIITSQYFRTLH